MVSFTKYIKSATYNTKFSQKTERILKLIFFSIWLVALIPTLIVSYHGIISIPLYFKSIELKNKYQDELSKNRKNSEQEKISKQIYSDSKNKPKARIFTYIDSINKDYKEVLPKKSQNFKESENTYSPTEVTTFDLRPWQDVGINNPSPDDDRMPNQAIEINSSLMKNGLISIILYLLLYFLPWILIRTYFWIKSANTTPVSH